jgi:ABC-3C protein
MDAITRAHYEMCFKVAFMEKKADEFQGFFSDIMEKRYPSDFVRVRPWGKVGDKKNDGYLKSKRMLFQCYAPNGWPSAATEAKIAADLAGALPHWKEWFGTWVFVHNSREGLGPDVLALLLQLGTQHQPLLVTQWGFEELRQEALQLAEPELASLFGPAPSRAGMVALGLDEVRPVLDHIALLNPVAAPDLRPVPADKLQRNLLSGAVEELLRAGMGRADPVRKYFKLKPTIQDRIAEAFRQRYGELRASNETPDAIFAALQRFVGGHEQMPATQNAVLAVLAFFFEECDIFERPEAQGQIP